MNSEMLLAHYERIADAPDAVARLRRFVLDLAVRGKLVPQDARDEPAIKFDDLVSDEFERPFEIPLTWKWSRMQALGKLRGGGTPSKARSEFWVGEIPWVSPKDMKVDYIASAEMNISEAALAESAANLIEEGSILFVVRGMILAHSFPVALSRVPLAINQDMKALVLRRPDMAEFLLRAFKGIKPQMLKRVRHSTHGTCRLEGSDYSEFLIPIPPSAEQRRIVAKVNELMALCDRLEAARTAREAARDRLAAATLARLNTPDPETFPTDARFAFEVLTALTTRPDQIKQLRQTILNLAVRGKLLRQDSTKDSPVREVTLNIVTKKRGQIREAIAQPFDLPKGWTWRAIDTIAEQVTDGEHATPPRISEQQVPLVTAKNVREGFMDYAQTDWVSFATAQKAWGRCKPTVGDLLLVCVGATTGRLTVLREPCDMVLVRSVALIRPSAEADPEYLERAIRSQVVQEQIWASVKAAAQPCLYINRIQSLLVPLPPLAEQRRIVAKVDALMSLCDRLEASLTASAATRRRLLDALLAEALSPAESLEREAAE